MTTKKGKGAAMLAATYEQMRVEQLRPHPKNIRTEVVPSDELVASVKRNGILQALVVAPSPTLEGDYTVIAGHHRLAAAKKAGLDQVPVCVRHDLLTDDLQVAAMVQENGHRKDLTVVEEATAFQTLMQFEGWDAKRVATETGVSQRKVRDRVKLTRLGDEARQKLAAGQVSLERAMALAEFAGEPEEDELVQMLGTHETNWGWHVARAKKTRDWRARVPALRVELGAAGVEVLDEDPDAGKAYAAREWETAMVETPEEAAAVGARAVLDSRFEAGVRYIVRKPVRDEQEDAELARAEAEAQAREDALTADLAGLDAVELAWIRETVLPAAKRGDERVTRVAARHLASCLGENPDWELPFRAADILGIEMPRAATVFERREALSAALAGRSLVEVAVVDLLARVRRPLDRLRYWDDICEGSQSSTVDRWFRLREQLGWDLTDPEKAALAYAEENNA